MKENQVLQYGNPRVFLGVSDLSVFRTINAVDTALHWFSARTDFKILRIRVTRVLVVPDWVDQ
jgi:hypothetical protein